MRAQIKKDRVEISREILNKLRTQTSITATGAGSVARAFADVFASEAGDLYEILDYNISQTLVSTATGSALDQLGNLYGLTRKTINELATIDAQLGSFEFFLTQTIGSDVVIPAGTNVYTKTDSSVGRRFSYSTTADAIIRAGRSRVYVSIKPNFIDSVYTAGPNTLVEHDMVSPPGATLLCRNSKTIAPAPGFETDENFRLRIMKSIRVNSGGTKDAMRFAALGVNGVRDVKIRQAPYGLGSFETIIIPEADNPNTTAVLRAAETAMETVRPMGVRMYVKSPNRIQVSIEVQLIANKIANKQAIASRAQVAIRRYINSLLPGDPIVYNRLVQIIIDSSEAVKDIIIKSFRINGQEVMRKNYQPAEDEQLIIGDIIPTVALS